MPTLRIALWSGPRNISTAMMRAWENRPDAWVCDEPFYAHFLAKTGLNHPGHDEVLRHHETDVDKVIAWLTGEERPGKTVFFQKHMTHHLTPDIDRGWLTKLTHGFLIRDPREMLPSLLKIYPQAQLSDTGLPQQRDLYDYLANHANQPPPILDAKEVLQQPEVMLRKLCERLGVEFTPAMLSWPAGRRDTDGVWAKYWYASVEKSTGFEPYRPKEERVSPRHQALLEACMAIHDDLHRRRLKP